MVAGYLLDGCSNLSHSFRDGYIAVQTFVRGVDGLFFFRRPEPYCFIAGPCDPHLLQEFQLGPQFAYHWLDVIVHWQLLLVWHTCCADVSGFDFASSYWWRDTGRDDTIVLMDTDDHLSLLGGCEHFNCPRDSLQSCVHLPWPSFEARPHCPLSMCGAEDTGTSGPYDHLLRDVGSYAMGIILSVMAIMQASLWRLLLFGCPLRGGECNADPLIRVGRHVVRGAPLRFWLLFLVLQAVPCAVAAPRRAASNVDEAPIDVSDQRILEVEQRIRDALHHRDAVADALIGPRVYPPPARPPAEVPEDEPSPPVRVPLRILRYQRSEIYMALWLEHGVNSEDVVARATAVLLGDDSHHYLLEAHPQPDDDVITLALAPRWWRRQPFVPIVVDRSPWGRAFYLETLPRRSTYEAVTHIVYPALLPDQSVTVENSLEPLDRGGVVFLTEGALVRVAPAQVDQPPLVALDVALQNLDWSRDLATFGMPTSEDPRGKLLVLSADHSFLLTTDVVTNRAAVLRQVASLLQYDIRDVYLVWPEDEDMDHISFQGRPTAGAVGVYTYDERPLGENWCAIFIDARDLACELTFQVFTTNLLSVNDLLQCLGVEVPAGMLACVEGFEAEVEDDDRFLFLTGATATLWLDPFDFYADDEDGGPPDDGDHGLGDEQSDGPAGSERPSSSRHPPRGSDPPGAARSRSPRGMGSSTASHISLSLSDCWDETCDWSRIYTGRPDQYRDLRDYDISTLLESSGALRSEAAQKVMVTAVGAMAGRSPPVALSLSTAAGPHAYDLTCPGVHFRSGFGSLCQLCKPWDGFCPSLNLDYFDLHPSTTAALVLTSPLEPVQSLRKVQIYTDGSADGGQAAWAAVLVGHTTSNTTSLLGAFGAHLNCDAWSVVYGGNPDALHAEQYGVLWALLWTMQWMSSIQVACVFECLFDNIAAGFGAAGTMAPPGATQLSLLIRGVAQALESMRPNSLVFTHVPGHMSQPWNELADTLAKTLMRRPAAPIAKPPIIAAKLVADVNWQWDWTYASPVQRLQYPALCSDGLTWSPMPPVCNLRPEQLIPVVDHACPPVSGTRSRLCVASANLQGIRGKHQILEQQAVSSGYHVLFLQETKEDGGAFVTQNFIRIGSKAETHWGVAVWIARNAFREHGRDKLALSDVTVVHTAPRVLAVVIQLDQISLLLVSAHFPYKTRPAAEIAEIQNSFAEVVEKFGSSRYVLAGVDANTRLPTDFAGVTGSLLCGDADELGARTVALFHRCGCYVPSTFPDLHFGESVTWRHPNGHASRIDFILLDTHLTMAGVSSWVDDDFDLLCAGEDHSMVGVLLTLESVPPAALRTRIRRQKFDGAKMLSAEGRAQVASELSRIPPIPWTVDVHEHALRIQSCLEDVMQRCFPLEANRPRSGYIPDDVWRQRNARLHLKRRTRSFNDTFRIFCLQEAWNVWAVDQCPTITWRKARLLHELFSAAVKFSAGAMKQMLRVCKAQRLDAMASKLGNRPFQEVQAELRQLGLGSKRNKKPGFALPDLCDERGQLAVGQQGLDDVWLRYFNEMECGNIITTEEFLSKAGCCSNPDISLHIDALPTLLETEAVLRAQKRNRASGLDSVPGELLLAQPSAMARLLHPLFTKAAATVCSPLQWKGGLLQEAWKGAGSTRDQASYRSLFISSNIGKCYHRILRQKTVAKAEAATHALHCGARRGAPVTMPALVAQLVARKMKAAGEAVCFLFLDTKSAYYRVVRELATGDIVSDAATVAVFRRFGLSPDDLRDMMKIVAAGGTMAANGVSDHMRSIVQDLYRDTWAVTRYGDSRRVSHSLAGSRPGESWADLIFSFVYSRILRKIAEEAAARDFAATVPWNGCESPWSTLETAQCKQLPLPDVTWADDSAFIAMAKNAVELTPRMLALVEAVLSACARHGLIPNLKLGKTGIVLAMRGAGKKRELSRLFPDNQKTLEVRSASGELSVVHIQAQYTHLGGVLDRDGSMAAEARRRLAMARSSFDRQRRMLFQNRYVCLQVRGNFFRSLVTSTFNNLALWTDRVKSWPTLATGYDRLLRRLLLGRGDPETVFKMSPSEVYWHVQQMPLGLLASLGRLTLLGSIVRQNAPTLWSVLQWEKEWAEQVRADLRWLRRWSLERLPDIDADEGWMAWTDIFTARVLWFKQQCRAAAKRAFAAVLESGGVDCFLRDLLKEVPRAKLQGLVTTFPTTWRCFPCNKPFATKAALATHMFRKHGRRAGFRRYATGSYCFACGTEFYDHFRLQVHLRDSGRCCDVLAATGRFTADGGPGLGSRACRMATRESFPLCPPQATGEAILCKETCDRRWDEVPAMRRAFTELATHILEVTQYNLDNIASDVYDILLQYPLFPDEYAMVLQRIADDAADIVALGEFPWGDDSATMVQVLRTIALSSELYLFTRASGSRVDDSLPAHRLSETDWASFLTHGSTSPARTIYVALDDAQGTNCAFPCTEAVDGRRFLELCKQGQIDDCAVVVHAPRCLEAAEYLGVRAAQSTALGRGRMLLWQALLCAWSYACKGGVIQLLVLGDPSVSGVLLPFRSVTSLAAHA